MKITPELFQSDYSQNGISAAQGASYGQIFTQLLSQSTEGVSTAPVHSENAVSAQQGISELLSTNQGMVEVDLDSYFSNDTNKSSTPVTIDSLPPLLFPSGDNIKAISEHLSERMQTLMKEYGIPEGPDGVTYDGAGQIILPEDYPYKEAFMTMLEDHPGVAKEMQTLYAISTHYAAIQEVMPYIEEMKAAVTQAQIDSINQKYAYLFNDNRRMPEVSLSFASNGLVSIFSNVQSLDLA